MIRVKRNSIFLAAAVLLACAAAWPLLSGGGLLNTRGGGDSPFLLQRLQQLETAVRDGHLPVRWMPDANYGYGYPFFNFYAPFAFYTALFFRFLGAGLVRAVQLSQLAAFVTAAAAMFALARRWLHSDRAALLTAAAYTFAPFHLANVYVRGDSIAEFWAMAWFPVVILALDNVGERGTGNRQRVAAVIGLGLAYAGLVLSHNISAMIFSPFILLYAFFKLLLPRSHAPLPPVSSALQPARSSASLLLLSLALTLGLALSAWFWLPALGEQGLTRLDEITVGYFDYSYNDGYHFRSADLVQGSLIYDPDVDGGRAFRMGLVQALLAAAGALALLLPAVGRRLSPAARWMLPAGFALATLMITPLSRPLWDLLPLLPYTQFPWRFLSIQAFWGAGLAGIAALWLDQLAEKWETGRGLFVDGLLAALLLFLVWTGLGGLRLDYLPLADKDISAERLAQYEWFSGNIGTTISAEYLSAGVEPRVYASRWLNSGERRPVDVRAGEADLTPLAIKTGRQSWTAVVGGDGAIVVFPTMFWPGWTAEIDGQPAELQPAPGSGLMQLAVPDGPHDITLKLTRTPLRLAAELLSLVALVGGIVLLGLFWRPLPGNAGRWLPAGSVILLFLIAVWMAEPAPPAVDAPQTWDFAQLGYLHPEEEIGYGSGARLAGYSFSADEVRAGETLELTLNWAAAPAGDVRQAEVALTTPADNFYSFVAPIAAESRPLQPGAVRYSLQIPADAPTGLFVPRLMLSDDNRVRTPAGAKRGTIFLAPVRVLPATGIVITTDPPDTPLDVRPLSVSQRPDVRVLDVRLQWWTDQPLAENLVASLRLGLPDGRQIYEAQFDLQPGYGYRPSGDWPAGEWVNDWLTLDMRKITFDPPYILLVNLYEGESGQTRLTRRFGELAAAADGGPLLFTANRPVYEAPAEMTPVGAELLDESGEPLLELVGYRADIGPEKVDLTLFWRALGPISADYTHFVHLLDPQSGRPAAQHDAMPRNNSYPTGQWLPGEVVSDPAVLSLAGLPAGEYAVTAGFYREENGAFPRLTAVLDGGILPGESIPLFTVTIGP